MTEDNSKKPAATRQKLEHLGGKQAGPPKYEVFGGELPEIRPGMTVRVHQKIREKDIKGVEKERVQVFEGIVLARKHKKEPGATIMVRKIAAGGIGVEKIFPIHSPTIVKIEIVKSHKVRRAKLYYLRSYKKRLKKKK